MNKMITMFKPTLLTDAQRDELEKEIGQATKVLAAEAVRIYPETVSNKVVRDDFKKGTIQLSLEGVMAMGTLMELEPYTISAYVAQAQSLATQFYSPGERPGVSRDDYLQEAVIAIYNAMYTYDGSVRLVTYCYHLMRRALIDFIRVEDRRAFSDRFSDDVFRLLSDGFDVPDDLAIVHEMEVALEETPLSDLERGLVMASITGDHEFRGRVIKSQNNPNTGRPYNRATLSQIYMKACAKVRDTYTGGEAA